MNAMKTSAHRLVRTKLLGSSLVLAFLAGCGANTSETSNAGTNQSIPSGTIPDKELSEPVNKANVLTVFVPALGSSGNGVVMADLKSHGGQLREPNAKYDVYDPSSTADPKTVKQNILEGLDREHRVLVDSDGTPESRAKAAAIVYDAIGASLPDISAVIIRKTPESMGGGYDLIPIYSKADVAEQISKGKINKAEELSNSVENFFFEPPKGSR